MIRGIGQASLAMKLFALLALLVVEPAAASTTVATGDRVRVTLIAHEPTPIVGRVLELPVGTIVIAAEPDSAQRTIARAAIAQFEVQRGTRTNAARGAMIGALILGAPAAFLGAVAGGTGHGEGSDATAASGAVSLGAIGVVVGAGLGALVGKSEKRERWEKVTP